MRSLARREESRRLCPSERADGRGDRRRTATRYERPQAASRPRVTGPAVTVRTSSPFIRTDDVFARRTGKGERMTMTATSGDSTTLSDTVDLRVPADPAYLAVLRTATAGLAARLDLTLDEIEDLRIAVDEACALLLEHTSHLGEELHA